MRGTVSDLASRLTLLDLLPGIYHDDEIIGRLVAAFDAAMAPAVAALDNFSAYLDPTVAPSDFLHWLARWVGIVDVAGIEEPRLRLFVHRAADLHARRGTARGLADLLEIVTGQRPDIVESGGVTASVTPGTSAPGRGQPDLVVRIADEGSRSLTEAVVAGGRPVHVPFQVEVGAET